MEGVGAADNGFPSPQGKRKHDGGVEPPEMVFKDEVTKAKAEIMARAASDPVFSRALSSIITEHSAGAVQRDPLPRDDHAPVLPSVEQTYLRLSDHVDLSGTLYTVIGDVVIADLRDLGRLNIAPVIAQEDIIPMYTVGAVERKGRVSEQKVGTSTDVPTFSDAF